MTLHNIDDDVHPLDIRTDAALKDPSLVDLQTCKNAVHADRIKKEQEATEQKHERMREIYGEQMHAAPTQEDHNPEKIMQVSAAEKALAALAKGDDTDEDAPRGEVKKTLDALEWIETRIDGLKYDITQETDIDVRLSLLADLEEHREQQRDGRVYLKHLCGE